MYILTTTITNPYGLQNRSTHNKTHEHPEHQTTGKEIKSTWKVEQILACVEGKNTAKPTTDQVEPTKFNKRHSNKKNNNPTRANSMWKQKLLVIDPNTKESLAQNWNLAWVDGNNKTKPTTDQHNQHRTTREINWTEIKTTNEKHSYQINTNQTRTDKEKEMEKRTKYNNKRGKKHNNQITRDNNKPRQRRKN